MSRNHILSRVYFVSLLSVCCMYLCWCISLIPLQTLTRPVQFVEQWLFVPILISGLITFLFDKDKWFTASSPKIIMPVNSGKICIRAPIVWKKSPSILSEIPGSIFCCSSCSTASFTEAEFSSK